MGDYVFIVVNSILLLSILIMIKYSKSCSVFVYIIYCAPVVFLFFVGFTYYFECVCCIATWDAFLSAFGLQRWESMPLQVVSGFVIYAALVIGVIVNYFGSPQFWVFLVIQFLFTFYSGVKLISISDLIQYKQGLLGESFLYVIPALFAVQKSLEVAMKTSGNVTKDGAAEWVVKGAIGLGLFIAVSAFCILLFIFVIGLIFPRLIPNYWPTILWGGILVLSLIWDYLWNLYKKGKLADPEISLKSKDDYDYEDDSDDWN